MMARRLDPDQLVRWRIKRGFKRWDLARRSGVSIYAIRNAERGHTRMPYPETMRRLAGTLGCTVDDLLTKEDTSTPGP